MTTDDTDGAPETIEGADGAGAAPGGSHDGARITAVAIAAIIVAAVVAYGIASPIATRQPVERRAAAILRVIGCAQLAFQGASNDRFYGSFEDLKLTRYISQDETAGSMIEGYTLAWSIRNHVEPFSDFGTDGLANSFTIVAYPRSDRFHLLRTFAITDDQVLRVYNPVGGNVLTSVTSWDPVSH